MLACMTGITHQGMTQVEHEDSSMHADVLGAHVDLVLLLPASHARQACGTVLRGRIMFVMFMMDGLPQCLNLLGLHASPHTSADQLW
jgi:hypothetical protein